jgi:serine/threonine-protein kinase
MGEVFAATQAETGARRALKALGPSAPPELRERFAREALALAEVGGHPNVVQIHTAGEHRGTPYLVMDLAESGDLSTRLGADGLPQTEAIQVVSALCDGVAHLHACGLLHRDLKPSNVLFSGGRPLVTDFGLAKLVGASTLTEAGTLLGTPAYMAPEQARGEPATTRTDVYGLGAILYAALTGRPPFAGSGLGLLDRVARLPPTPPSQLRPEIDARLEELCLRTLAKAPADRPASAQDLAQALRALQGQGARAGSRRRLILGLVGAALALSAAGGWSLAAGWDRKPLTSPPASDPPASTARARVAEEYAAFMPPRLAEPWNRRDGGSPNLEDALTRFQRSAPRVPSGWSKRPPSDRVGQLARGVEEGDVSALLSLANRCRSGVGVNPQRPRLAASLFLRARSSPRATAAERFKGTLGAARVLRQLPGALDLDLAGRLFAHAARETGDPWPAWHLAEMLAGGVGFAPDPEEAERWLQPFQRDASNLGRLRTLRADLRFTGLLEGASQEEAIELYRNAIFLRHGGVALARLCVLQDKEERPVESLVEATRTLEKTVPRERRGKVGRLHRVVLGDIRWEEGAHDAAIRLYQDATSEVHPVWNARGDAHLRLSRAYARGQGASKAPAAAAREFELAIYYGSTEALLELARAFSGTGAELACFRTAAALGDPTAMEAWATLLEDGACGLRPSPKAAAAWRARATHARRWQRRLGPPLPRGPRPR